MTLPQAVALGLLHGPAELAPVSSSAHTTLLAWRRGWGYGELEPAARKRFEVALHAGTAVATLWRARGALTDTPVSALVAASLPPALAGALLQRPIERRLGTPAGIAAGLLAGSAAMALADVLGSRQRLHTQARGRDGLILGLAQAAALIPGVSRSGAARAAARARGFAPPEARVLADAVGVPITLGALALKGREALRGERSEWAGLAVGATASLGSALASAPLAARAQGRASLLPYCAYRTAVASAVIRRLRQNARR
ncbi:MAG TPA: undecaprenyl-diphosphate phosphatase [Solirubrobacteraceae bacterium]